jgi:thiosulfate/3-mercaptopyruvate sulfurtransferase
MRPALFSLRAPWRVLIRCVVTLAVVAAAVPANPKPDDPWKAEQTVQAPQFAEELQQGKDGVPVVIYVGVRVLYEGGHIPGAVYYGAGSSEQGISELKKYAEALPQSSNVVLYCGCCPLEKCPNLRPAFNAVKDLGFARLRVLILPTSFNADWVERGFPVHKGNEP